MLLRWEGQRGLQRATRARNPPSSEISAVLAGPWGHGSLNAAVIAGGHAADGPASGKLPLITRTPALVECLLVAGAVRCFSVFNVTETFKYILLFPFDYLTD